jgi:hypothetical protein
MKIKGAQSKSKFIISVVDAEEEERRDRSLTQREQAASGKRGQPPMTHRLRAVTVLVENLEARGVRFATARNSKMNKLVGAWLNERMQRSQDTRKSRRGTLGPDAIEDLLKQVAAHRKLGRGLIST